MTVLLTIIIRDVGVAMSEMPLVLPVYDFLHYSDFSLKETLSYITIISMF